MWLTHACNYSRVALYGLFGIGQGRLSKSRDSCFKYEILILRMGFSKYVCSCCVGKHVSNNHLGFTWFLGILLLFVRLHHFKR